MCKDSAFSCFFSLLRQDLTLEPRLTWNSCNPVSASCMLPLQVQCSKQPSLGFKGLSSRLALAQFLQGLPVPRHHLPHYSSASDVAQDLTGSHHLSHPPRPPSPPARAKAGAPSTLSLLRSSLKSQQSGRIQSDDAHPRS